MDSDLHQDLLTPDSKNHLVAAGSWARFIGIIGFVFTAFFGCLSLALIFGGSALMSAISAASAEQDSPAAGLMKGSGMLIGLLYLIITAIYFLISWWTYKFGTEIKQGLRESSPEYITSAMSNLKNYFQAYGVLTLIALSIMVFSMLTVMMVGYFH
jgi:hypothetical protein